MIKAEFASISRALDHAEQVGGWIFTGPRNITWYDARHYTMTQILMEESGEGHLYPWAELKRDYVHI